MSGVPILLILIFHIAHFTTVSLPREGRQFLALTSPLLTTA